MSYIRRNSWSTESESMNDGENSADASDFPPLDLRQIFDVEKGDDKRVVESRCESPSGAVGTILVATYFRSF